MHIGEKIQEVLREKRIPVSEFARLVHSDRSNMYRILSRESIDTSILYRYSRVLNYNFFRDLSDEFMEKEAQ